MPVTTVFWYISIFRYVRFSILQSLWEQRIDVRKCVHMLIRESECSMLLRVSAVAGIMGFGMGGRGGGVVSRVNVILVSFYVFYVYFLFSCVHAALITSWAQLRQVLYLLSLVLGWGQVELSLADDSIVVIGTPPQNFPNI